MTDNTQPEALRLAEQYDYSDPAAHGNAWKAAVCIELRRQHARIAELEAQLEAVGAGGMQALSAAPPSMYVNGAGIHAEDGASAVIRKLDARFHDIVTFKAVDAAAASPTPPAEQQTTTKAAPVGQNTVPAEWLEQAYREGWAACRDAENIGEDAEDWEFGKSTANSRMIDAQQAALQQEAQEPAVDDPTRWFTVVYRDISPGDEARLLGEHPKASAMSWSHAIRDRDAARKQGASHDR